MEPEAQRVIGENLHRNFIDHAEYPQTAEIEQRCIRMLADLFNAPGETTGARTQGSSEAIMLGALSLKWKRRERIAWQVAAERGWMLPAYTMPPNADKVKMLRALVKLNLTHALVGTLADDIANACEPWTRRVA